MDAKWHDLSPAGLAAANEANIWAFFRMLGRWSRAAFREDQESMSFSTGIAFPLLNGVTGARFAPEQLDEKIAAVLRPFKDGGLPMLWWVSPSTQPADLGARLEQHGLTHIDSSPGLAIDLLALDDQQPPVIGLEIERVASEASLDTWLIPFAAGFELPDFVAQAVRDLTLESGFDPQGAYHCYVGRLNGAPVASASLFLGAGVAGVYNVATIAEARGRGIGAAITAAALRAARAANYRVGILQSSAMGLGVYRRLGFRECCTIDHYLWASEGEQAEAHP